MRHYLTVPAVLGILAFCVLFGPVQHVILGASPAAPLDTVSNKEVKDWIGTSEGRLQFRNFAETLTIYEQQRLERMIVPARPRSKSVQRQAIHESMRQLRKAGLAYGVAWDELKRIKAELEPVYEIPEIRIENNTEPGW